MIENYQVIEMPRLYQPGYTPATKGKGRNFLWLKERIDYVGDDCLIWPFSRMPHGRGNMGYNGKMIHAHRLMCILAHGEPPTSKHQAAHNCGKGHLGCVNPRHLEWKTCSENHLDRRRHGTTATNRYGNRGALSAEQVRTIRARQGAATQAQLAKEYGVSPDTIGRIWRGQTYAKTAEHSRRKP